MLAGGQAVSSLSQGFEVCGLLEDESSLGNHFTSVRTHYESVSTWIIQSRDLRSWVE